MPAHDLELLERYRQGDLEAFDEIYNSYFAPLLGFLTRMCGDREDASGVLQDTMSLERRQERPMPMYEYACQECKRSFEVLQKVGDKEATCPQCGSENTRRMISAFSSNLMSKGVCSTGPGSL